MAEVTVGIREFKAHLSEYLRRVKAGETIVLTERGKVLGRLAPPTTEERIRQLVREGKVQWSGKMPMKIAALPGLAEGYSLSDLIIEMRGEHDEPLPGQ